MTKDEALKMAIEALEWALSCIDASDWEDDIYMSEACGKYARASAMVQKGKEALEQPAQEPVEWLDEMQSITEKEYYQEPVAIVYSMQDGYVGQMVVKDIPHKTPLYTKERTHD